MAVVVVVMVVVVVVVVVVPSTSTTSAAGSTACGLWHPRCPQARTPKLRMRLSARYTCRL